MATEQGVKFNLARFRTLFTATAEVLPVPVVVIDPNGSIVLINREAERLFGYGPDELLAQPVETLIPERFRARHPDQRTGFFANPVSRPMGAGRDVYGRRKDGSELPVEIGLSPVETDEGSFALSVIVDITERRQRENELKSLMIKLNESNRELEQFAVVASHDLQEPLRKVACCCQALGEDYADKLDEEGREWIALAIDGAMRMRGLVNDLLDFSRVATRGKAAEPTDAHQACQIALRNLADTIHEHNARICCRHLPIVAADASQLVRLFQNLIGNSIKYSGDHQPIVEIGAESNDDHWQFYVKDNGIGIPPEYHERIFQIFQRLHRKEDYPGTGIGLAICKKVVERLGGRMWVASEPGHGSTFFFTFRAIDSVNVGVTDNDLVGNSDIGSSH